MKSFRFIFSLAAATLVSAPAGAETAPKSALSTHEARQACPRAYSLIGRHVARKALSSSRHAPAAKAAVVSLEMPNGSWMSTIDMNWVLLNPTSALAKLIQVAESQRKLAYLRLEKFKNRNIITAASKADQALMARSVYVMNTTRPINTLNNEVQGGIRVVFARSETEKLPWEIDLGRSRSNPGPAAEFGRLHSNSGSTAGTVIELIRSAAQVASKHPEIRDFYFHTSRIHGRLYRRMGLEPDFVDEIDDLNHVWHLKRETLMATLQKKSRSELPQ